MVGFGRFPAPGLIDGGTPMSGVRCAFLGSLCLVSIFAVLTPAAAQSRPADKPLATRELDVEGVVAEVIESDRKDGVLTVRVRFRNNGAKPAKLLLVDAQGYVH